MTAHRRPSRFRSVAKSKEGIIKTPAIIGAGEKEYKYASGTTGNVEITVEPGGGEAGRQSWRQLQ